MTLAVAQHSKLCQSMLGGILNYKLISVYKVLNFMFDFPCIISLYYTKNQQDATLAVLFIGNCKINLHVSDALYVHHQEY